MVKLGLCSILLFFASLIQVQACGEPYNTARCTFYSQGTSNDCANFQFHYCEYQVCSTVASDGSCSSYKAETQYDWNSCLQSCCQISGAPQTYETLNSCFSSNQSAAIIIGTTVGLGIFLIATFIIACCCFREKLKSCWEKIRSNICKTSESPQVKPQKQDKVISWRDFSKTCGVREPDDNPWIDCEEIDHSQIRENNCAICLADGPTLKLSCSHLFHRECIMEWVRKKRECPLCKSWHFHSITSFCETCTSKKKSKPFFLDELFHSPPQQCDSCKN